MADQQPVPGGNGSGDGGNEPQVSILAQYIKDLSVENPSAPQVFSWQVQPSLDVQFNIAVNSAAENVHEVILKVEINAKSENGVHFIVDPIDFTAAYMAQLQAQQGQEGAQGGAPQSAEAAGEEPGEG